MANLFLDANDLNIHVSNPMKVYGSTGTESVLVDANTTGVVVDQNVERVDLPGAASAFTYQQAGNALKVYSGGTLVATIPLQGDADGTQVVFSNGSVHATLVAGVMTLGGTTVTTTAAAVTPATIDTAITSGSSTGGSATPTFSVATAASVTEGNTATFTVTLSSAQGTASTVAFALEGTGGAVLGTDTGAAIPGATGTLTFAPGEVTKTVTVPVTFDSTTETGEGLKVTLSSPSTGTALGTSTATTTIADPTAPTFTITSNVTPGASTEEGNTITYTITPNGVTDKAYTFTLSTIGDTLSGVATAASATDFSPASQTITFAAGSTKAQTVVQTIVNDGVTEGLEGYKTSLLDASYTAVSSVTGTINDPITVPVGTTYALTTAVDNFTGTSGNDTFIADNSGTTATSTVGDQVNGGLGTDIIKYYAKAADTTLTLPTFTNIESLYVNGGAVTAYTAPTGITTLSIDSPVANTAATYTLAGQDISLANHVVGANTTTTIAAAATSTHTAQNVTLNNQSAATGFVNTLDLSGTKVATLNLTTTGAASTVSLTNTGAAIRTINLAGDKNLTITENAAMAGAVTKIDASTATGNMSVNASAALTPAAFTFTGGAGNDTITFINDEFATLTAGTQLAGGAGTGDKIGIFDAALTAAETAKINAATGFEVLGLNAAITLDASTLTSIKQFSIDTTALTQTINNMATGSATTITAAAPTSLTLASAVGVNDTTINLGVATTAGVTVGTLVTTGITNIALSSNGLAANTITTLTNSDNSSFTVTGAQDLTFTLSAGAAIGSKVDASAFTGKLTVSGSSGAAFGDILIGGSGADTINGLKGADTLTGNGGADTFSFTAAAAANAGGTTFGNADVITDFTVGTDKIQFAGVVDVVSGQQAAVQTAVTALAAGSTDIQIATAMATANTTNLGVSIATFGGNTYVLYETTGASTGVAADDVFIKLTGVTAPMTFAADVVA